MRAYMCASVPSVNTWQKYVQIVGEDSSDMTQTAIGERTGIAQSTISRWLRGTKLPTEAAQVAKFAQSYKRNPLEAFVAAGMLTEAEAGRGLSAADLDFLKSLRSKPKVADIRDRQVSRADDLERDIKSGKKAARTRNEPPRGR